MTTTASLPADRFGFSEIARATVAGRPYVVVSEERFRWVFAADDFDAETTADYEQWNRDVSAVRDRSLLVNIARAASLEWVSQSGSGASISVPNAMEAVTE